MCLRLKYSVVSAYCAKQDDRFTKYMTVTSIDLRTLFENRLKSQPVQPTPDLFKWTPCQIPSIVTTSAIIQYSTVPNAIYSGNKATNNWTLLKLRPLVNFILTPSVSQGIHLEYFAFGPPCCGNTRRLILLAIDPFARIFEVR